MTDFLKICLPPNSTIENALSVIDIGAIKIAVVIDLDDKLLGTLSDGDIRRGLLRKKTMSDTIEDIYRRTPTFARHGCSREDLIGLCRLNSISYIPILDDEGKLIDLFCLNDKDTKKIYSNKVVLMVGGLGTRLMPLTESTPKSMLTVGDKPILETIINGFVSSGFINITMCLGYKSKAIGDYFEDGHRFGARIDYIVEDKRMGTAGALTLLKNKPDESFFVMNGDLLTNIDFQKVLDFHVSHSATATMCVRNHEMSVPYGVVNVNSEDFCSIKEKPIHQFLVNAGIYLLEPECIELIPHDQFYDMPLLFEKLVEANKKPICFPLREYWLDIGRIGDYEKANIEYHGIFKR